MSLFFDRANLQAVGIASNTANGTFVTLTALFSQAEVDAMTINNFGINTSGLVAGTAVWDNVSLNQIPEPATLGLCVISGTILVAVRRRIRMFHM